MVASRNLGVRDYFADPAMKDADEGRTLEWRMNLTEPDGHLFAVGDTDRDTVGAEELIEERKTAERTHICLGGPDHHRAWTAGNDPGDPYELFHS